MLELIAFDYFLIVQSGMYGVDMIILNALIEKRVPLALDYRNLWYNIDASLPGINVSKEHCWPWESIFKKYRERLANVYRVKNELLDHGCPRDCSRLSFAG